ncbi:hypothetical protein M514_26165 [Trichuris suis]|uniref:Uncharacterized protein n=1 Tax=Trichuris suis TaxID=68888 RepID=A0A085MWQ0_9BILA|nr:hypothetical protein M514_26165 [Trichuris suis]
METLTYHRAGVENNHMRTKLSEKSSSTFPRAKPKQSKDTNSCFHIFTHSDAQMATFANSDYYSRFIMCSNNYEKRIALIHSDQTNMSSFDENQSDKDLEQKCRRACEDASECLHLMAHEPSLGLYRVQEHARKSTRQTDKALEMINNAVYDTHTAFVSAGGTFKRAFENMRTSVHLKLRLEGHVVKQQQIPDGCRQQREEQKSGSLSPLQSFDECDTMLSESLDSVGTFSTVLSD